MTDDEIEHIMEQLSDIKPNIYKGWPKDAIDAIIYLYQMRQKAEQQRDGYRQSYEAACEREVYWQGVAADYAAKANDVRGQW